MRFFPVWTNDKQEYKFLEEWPTVMPIAGLANYYNPTFKVPLNHDIEVYSE